MKAFLRRLPGGLLKPDDEESAEALKTVAMGEIVAVEWHRPRNHAFHRKLFAMLDVGFQAWEPATIDFRGLPAQKNFTRFRKDVICAAGYYDVVVNLKGEVRVEPKSISFAAMDETEFGKLYNACADVLLQHVLRTYTRDDLDQVVAALVDFTA